MRQTPKVGDNRTGAAAAAKRFKEMIEGVQEFPPTSATEMEEIAQMEAEYIRDGDGMGSIPEPLKEVGEEGALLLDKLGERLAFERTGTRLYDALLVKLEHQGGFAGGPSREELEEIRGQELEHFRLLEQAIGQLGGDPTALTPSANLAATASQGVGVAIGDPRTTLLQCLEAILVAELTDNEGWEALVEMTRQNGEDELADQFERALDEEVTHLARVRRWVAAGQGRAETRH